MTEPTTPLDLEAIRSRLGHACGAASRLANSTAIDELSIADALAITEGLNDAFALLAALSEAQRERDANVRDAKTAWQLYRSEQADHNALKAIAEKLAERAQDADEAEADLAAAQPVLEAARALREQQRRDVIDYGATLADLSARTEAFRLVREAFAAAVDTYETQTGGTE